MGASAAIIASPPCSRVVLGAGGRSRQVYACDKVLSMAHFDVGSSQQRERESAATVARVARSGLILFAVYLVFYVAFVVLTAFAAEWMRTELAGVNVAIHAGFGLIVGAFLLALVYLWLCRGGDKKDAER